MVNLAARYNFLVLPNSGKLTGPSIKEHKENVTVYFSFVQMLSKTTDVLFPNLLICTGWGPHAYFQMLAESRNSIQSSTTADNLNVQQMELETVYVESHHHMQNSRFNARDTSPILNGSENER